MIGSNDPGRVEPGRALSPPLRGESPPGTSPSGGIRNLPSWWRGVRFRSRTEARWAAFFDALGVRWEYEPEGFQLPDGSRYLPDFWLPDFQLWVEVKGDQGPEYGDWTRIEQLVAGSGHALLLLQGQPHHRWFRRMYVETHGTESMLLTDWVCWSSRLVAEQRLWSGDEGHNEPRELPLEDETVADAIASVRAIDFSRRSA